MTKRRPAGIVRNYGLTHLAPRPALDWPARVWLVVCLWLFVSGLVIGVIIA